MQPHNEPYQQLRQNEKMATIWVGLLYRKLLKLEYFAMLDVNKSVQSLLKHIKYQIVLYCVWSNKISQKF